MGRGCATVNGGQRRISLGSHKANESASTSSIMLIVAVALWTKGRRDGRRSLNFSFTYQVVRRENRTPAVRKTEMSLTL